MTDDWHEGSFAKGFFIAAPIAFGLWALIVYVIIKLLGYLP